LVWILRRRASRFRLSDIWWKLAVDQWRVRVQANNLLGASYQLYRHAEANEIISRAASYVLLAALHWHVQTDADDVLFPPLVQQPIPRKRSSGAGEVCIWRASDGAVEP